MIKKTFPICIIIGLLFVTIPTIPAIEYSTVATDIELPCFNMGFTCEPKDISRIIEGGYGFLELFIAFLLFIYIQLGIIFNRSFTLILLLANLLYDLGVLFGLIEPNATSYLAFSFY